MKWKEFYLKKKWMQARQEAKNEKIQHCGLMRQVVDYAQQQERQKEILKRVIGQEAEKEVEYQKRIKELNAKVLSYEDAFAAFKSDPLYVDDDEQEEEGDDKQISDEEVPDEQVEEDDQASYEEVADEQVSDEEVLAEEIYMNPDYDEFSEEQTLDDDIADEVTGNGQNVSSEQILDEITNCGVAGVQVANREEQIPAMVPSVCETYNVEEAANIGIPQNQAGEIIDESERHLKVLAYAIKPPIPNFSDTNGKSKFQRLKKWSIKFILCSCSFKIVKA